MDQARAIIDKYALTIPGKDDSGVFQNHRIRSSLRIAARSRAISISMDTNFPDASSPGNSSARTRGQNLVSDR